MLQRLLPAALLVVAACSSDEGRYGDDGGASRGRDGGADLDARAESGPADMDAIAPDSSSGDFDARGAPHQPAEAGVAREGGAADGSPTATDTRVDGGAEGGGSPGPALATPPGYPEGPWGADVGDVIAPLVWTGHVNEDAVGLSTEQPVAPYSMDDLRTSGRPYALVHLSEWFCPGCRNAATDLGVLGPSIVAAGGMVVEILGTRSFFSPASLADVQAWIETYDLEVTTVTDAAGYELATFEAFGVRETAIIVDLSTMRVVWKMNGDLGGDLPSSINAATTEILSLLAN